MVFKILFLSATAYLIYLVKMKKPYCLGYDPKADNFNHYLFIYPPVLILTIIFHVTTRSTSYYHFEYFWSFSIWLEAFAIIPQLWIVYRKRQVDVITGSYMACLGCYRLFYVLSWIYQLMNNQKMIWLKFIAGIIQVLIYCEFLYYYFISAKVTGGGIQLPV